MTDRGPVRTYAVTVDGYDPILYSARSPAKARWRCYLAYSVFYTCSFAEFLARSKVRRADDPPGIGRRVMVCGQPATIVLGRSPGGIYFMRDDSDVIYSAHPSEVVATIRPDHSDGEQEQSR